MRPVPEEAIELNGTCAPGDLVKWQTLSGAVHFGILVEWDNGTAIIRLSDGRTVSIRSQ